MLFLSGSAKDIQNDATDEAGYYNVEVPAGRGENSYETAAYALAKVRIVFSKWDIEDAKTKT